MAAYRQFFSIKFKKIEQLISCKQNNLAKTVVEIWFKVQKKKNTELAAYKQFFSIKFKKIEQLISCKQNNLAKTVVENWFKVQKKKKQFTVNVHGLRHVTCVLHWNWLPINSLAKGETNSFKGRTEGKPTVSKG